MAASSRRRLWLLIGVPVLAVALVVFLAVTVLNGGSGPAAPAPPAEPASAAVEVNTEGIQYAEASRIS